MYGRFSRCLGWIRREVALYVIQTLIAQSSALTRPSIHLFQSIIALTPIEYRYNMSPTVSSAAKGDPHRISLHSQAYPSLEQLEDLLENGVHIPATLSPPSESTYPSTSTPAPVVEAERPNLVPVYIELPADLLTPVSAYLKIAAESKNSFLLESVVNGESLARYSFVGSGKSRDGTDSDEYWGYHGVY